MSESVLRHAKFIKYFLQEDPWMYGGKSVFNSHNFSLVVVGYFDIGCFTVGKPKAYSPLVINPDTPLPRPTARESFKAV